MDRLAKISCFQHFFEIINATYSSSSVTERLFFILRFTNDPSNGILLLATHVGGLGWNLTGADTVISVEHDWNPMKDYKHITTNPFNISSPPCLFQFLSTLLKPCLGKCDQLPFLDCFDHLFRPWTELIVLDRRRL